MQVMPLWLAVYAASRDPSLWDKTYQWSAPSDTGLAEGLLTADKVLVDRPFMDRYQEIKLAVITRYPDVRLNAMLPGSWFEFAPNSKTVRRAGILLRDTRDDWCHFDFYMTDGQRIGGWNGELQKQPEKGHSLLTAPAKWNDAGPMDGSQDKWKMLITVFLQGMSLFERRIGLVRDIPHSIVQSAGIGKYKRMQVRYIALDQPTPRRSEEIGTHASPCLHTVRGHWRWKGTEREHWVEAFRRGDPAFGEIVHEYGLRKRLPSGKLQSDGNRGLMRRS